MSKVVSWDGNAINDGTNYTAGLMGGGAQSLPDVEIASLPRSDAWPLAANILRPGRMHFLHIEIKNASPTTYRKQLHQWFDPEDETAKELIIDNDDGTVDRYVMAVCERLEDVSNGAGLAYLAHLRVHGDVRWRETVATTDSWSVTTDSATHTKTLTNNGADLAYPVIYITPTAAKAGGFKKRRQIDIRWLGYPASNYPLDVVDHSLDGAAEISGGDMDSDGDDARVYMDGAQVDRWLDGIADTDSAIWINANWETPHEGTLATAIASSDSTIDEIALSAVTSGEMKSFPASGFLRINAETFHYTARSVQSKKFTGISRAVHNTSAASHAAADTVWWVQHEIALYYGDSDLAAQTVDDDYKPIMTLATSTNLSWDYDEFGEDDGLRTGAWQFIDFTNSATKYTGNQGSDTNPWAEMGIKQNILGSSPSQAQWQIFHPCRLTNANFQNGEKRHDSFSTDVWTAEIRTRLLSTPGDGPEIWTTEDSIAVPTTDGAFESWTDNEILTAESAYVAMYLERAAGIPAPADQYIEVSDVTLSLDTDYTPVVNIAAEETIYNLSIRIKNTTTGDWIDVAFPMEVNQTLKIDTNAKTVTYQKDGSNQLQALTLVGGPRKDWLKLTAGANSLSIHDVTITAALGTELGALTIGVEWEERHYS